MLPSTVPNRDNHDFQWDHRRSPESSRSRNGLAVVEGDVQSVALVIPVNKRREGSPLVPNTEKVIVGLEVQLLANDGELDILEPFEGHGAIEDLDDTGDLFASLLEGGGFVVPY